MLSVVRQRSTYSSKQQTANKMIAKVFVFLGMIVVARGGFLNAQNQIQANSYASAVQHPGQAAVIAQSVQLPVATAASSSVNIARSISSSGGYVVPVASGHLNGYSAPLSASVPLASYAVNGQQQQVIVPQVIQSRVEPYDANPHYTYAYDVNDPHTGDSKNQHESRAGDVVRGQYSLTDPDGSRRTVDYTADPHNGFNAIVRRTNPQQHPITLPAYSVAAH